MGQTKVSGWSGFVIFSNIAVINIPLTVSLESWFKIKFFAVAVGKLEI